MKKLVSLILTLAMLLSMTTVIADEEIKVYVDGEQVIFDAQPFIENDRTLVPMRAIFEKLGANVTWDGKMSSVYAVRAYDNQDSVGRILIKLVIGNNQMLRSIDEDIIWQEYDKNEYVTLDSLPQIINDRTYIPLRAISEAFNCDVKWDDRTKTIDITSKDEIVEEIEISLLEDRLRVTVDVGMYNEFDSPYFTESARVDFNVGSGTMSMQIDELYYKSTGDLKKDVENLGLMCVEDIASNGGIEYACTSEATVATSNGYIHDKRYIVKLTDGFLVSVKFSEETEYVNKVDFDGAVEIVMEKVSDGDRELDISEKEISLHNLLVYQPKGYWADFEYAGEYVIWKIQQITTTEVRDSPRILIHYGSSSPSYDEEYRGNKPIKMLKGEFLGEKITWSLYEENNYMQALLKCENGYIYHIWAFAESFEQQQEFVDIVSKIEEDMNAGIGGKPVIYLYPEEDVEVNVKLELDGEFIFTYPEYNNGWTVTAKPDGTIISDGKEYSYLFWEGEMPTFKPDFKEGFVVKGSDSVVFLRETLEKMGLTPREYNEFIVYWAPKLQENEYNKIYFAQEEYEECAKLEITPEPDSILRVFMVYEEADENTTLPEQEIKPFKRDGFTVVEWGGYLAE